MQISEQLGEGEGEYDQNTLGISQRINITILKVIL